MDHITAKDFFDDNRLKFGLKVLAGREYLSKKEIVVTDINRPGLALAGFFDYFPYERLQIFGKTEFAYLKKLGKETAYLVLKRLFEKNLCCAVISRSIKPASYFLKVARQYRTPVISSSLLTTTLMNQCVDYLQVKLASRKTVHGTFVDVYGVGVLMFGKSGIGKSEISLELIKRGHRLIADDLIEIIRLNETELLGKGVSTVQHHMEIRGLGIIDIKTLFGIGAIRDDQKIDLVLCLEEWEKGKEYERLGIEEKFEAILEVNVPRITLPVKPGRNLSVIIEAAAMTQRLKSRGYNPAKELNDAILRYMKKEGK
jgi:HPr kinase/phosphorylase